MSKRGPIFTIHLERYFLIEIIIHLQFMLHRIQLLIHIIFIINGLSTLMSALSKVYFSEKWLWLKEDLSSSHLFCHFWYSVQCRWWIVIMPGDESPAQEIFMLPRCIRASWPPPSWWRSPPGSQGPCSLSSSSLQVQFSYIVVTDPDFHPTSWEFGEDCVWQQLPNKIGRGKICEYR